MTVEAPGHSPIYDRLVRERGDVLAETREVAEQAQIQAKQALDWSSLRPSSRKGKADGGFFAFD